MSKAKVTVVIPNYNGKKFMEDCMEALKAQEYPGMEVLLVDNGSSDGSAELVRERYPWVRLLELDQNYGFSRAVNEGIRAAETPYVILLNNDTKVRPGYTAALVRALDEAPGAFSASPKMSQMYRPELIDDAGDQYTVLGWAFQRGVAHSVKRYTRPARVFSACAGAAANSRIISRTVLISRQCSAFSGAAMAENPRLSAAFTRCRSFGTGRISPARLISPIKAVLSGAGRSVRAEYSAAASARSTALSVSRMPPATLT